MTTPDTFQSTTVAELHRLVGTIVEQCPELEGRAARAVAILLLGKVSQVGETTYEVVGTEAQPYTVDHLAETCTCADFTHRAPAFKGRKWCKHALAVLLLRKLGNPRRSPRADRLSSFRRRVSRRPMRKAA